MRSFTHRRRRVGSAVALVAVVAMFGVAPASALSQASATVKPAITSGRLHSCGLMAGGTVVCWGDNSYGELGNNSIAQSLVPVKVHGVGNVGLLSGVIAITAGNGFTCALFATKSVDCWGFGGDGELGDRSTARSLVPVKVHGVGNVGLLSEVIAITAGNDFACALQATKNVVCWGANGEGELGTDSTTTALTPVKVHGVGDRGVLSGVAAVSAGSADTPCALLATKTVVCWGSNTNGELGDNSFAGQLVPVKVHGVGNVAILGNVAAVTGAGTSSSCALIVGGKVDCWGFDGSLGINSSSGSSLTPVQVLGVGGSGVLNGIAAVSDHSDAPCALQISGAVDCWGSGAGDLLGDGTEDLAGNVPDQVLGVSNFGFLSGATAISAGQLTTCALLTGGTVDCWGTNGNGELGDDTTIDSGIPVQVRGVGNVGFLTL